MNNCSFITSNNLVLDAAKGQELIAASLSPLQMPPHSNISLFSCLPKSITWDEVANERSTAKLMQLCKEKRLPPQNFLLRAIIMGAKDWVQPLIDCGASPKEAFDYLTPALAWMSRYPEEPLPAALESSFYDKEIIERKLLGHVFEIDGNTIVNNHMVPLEGFSHSYFWNRIVDITKEIGNRNQTLSKINQLPLFEKVISFSDKETINFKESPIHIIKTGDKGARNGIISGHVSALVLSENFIAHVSDGIAVGRYTSGSLPTDIKKSLSVFSLTEESYKTVMKNLYKEIEATPIPILSSLNKRPFTQLVHNCAWKTPESTLFAVRLLDALESLLAEGKKSAQAIFKDCNSKILSARNDQESTSSRQKCEDDIKYYMKRFVENRGSSLVNQLIQDHINLIKKIKEFVSRKYTLYRNSLSDEIQSKVPIDFDLMIKISDQLPKNEIPILLN